MGSIIGGGNPAKNQFVGLQGDNQNNLNNFAPQALQFFATRAESTSDLITLNGTTVFECSVASTWLLFGQLDINSTNRRTSLRIELRRNGINVGETFLASYIRAASGHNESGPSFHFIMEVRDQDVGQPFQLMVGRAGNAGVVNSGFDTKVDFIRMS